MEAGIVSLLLFTILAGIVDVSSFFLTSYQVTQAARAGVRTASSDPLGSNFARNAALQVSSALRGAEMSRVTRVWVYKASTSTGQPTSGATCSSSCVRFTFDAGGGIASTSGTWTGRSACSGGTVDAVGVFVEYRNNAPIQFLDERAIGDRAVMRLEPQPSNSVCVSS